MVKDPVVGPMVQEESQMYQHHHADRGRVRM